MQAKEYNPREIESKWQIKWEKSGIYKADDSSKKPKFYILDMFPYVSGEGIHVGHPKGYIATDIVSRMKRMQGFNVLHPMGFDAFGLPAENYAIKTKTNPVIAVAKNIERYKKQLEMIGFDYDWSREVNTSDPKFYKWTQWIFLKLLEKGLAYESNEPVNWCPFDKTVLANEDVEDGKCERCGTVVEKKPIRQWVLKITDYAERMLEDLEELDWPKSIKESQKNWIGKSDGAEIDFGIKGHKEKIRVFTTRPDTIFGATYMVLAPEHALVEASKDKIDNWSEVSQYIESIKTKTDIDRSAEGREKTGVELKGIKAINPATTQENPVYIADYVLPHYGTGAIMAVPAHDERDFEFAQKHDLPVKHTIIPKLIDHKNPHVDGKKVVFRRAVIVIVRNPRTGKILTLKWKKQPWTTFVMGGIEGGENPVDTATREIQEETGYKNVKFVKRLGGPIYNEFFATHKDENRVAHTYGLLFDLIDDEMGETNLDSYEEFDVVWTSLDKINPDTITHTETARLLNKMSGESEVYTGEGVLISSDEFSGLNSEEAREKITEKFGKKVIKYKLRDWVFSRQRYWGEPIPVLKDGEKTIPLEEKDLPLVLPAVESYEPTGTAESPLSNIPEWINVKVGDKVLRRESNTMPQWAGSSWYYLRYMDPLNDKTLVDKKREKYWNMVDLYVGGAEHATRHLIYARFWHKFLYDIGVVSTKEPFKKLQHVGLIIAEDGRKMSKRWGNIISPDDIISTFGADTLRIYEMFMGPFDQSVSWNSQSIVGVRRFLERVWQLLSKAAFDTDVKMSKAAFDSTLVHQTIKKVSDDIETMKFNTAISTLMVFANELDKKEKVTNEEYETLLKLLAPFAPHVTEELWHLLNHKSSIHQEEWPKFDETKLVSETVTIVVQVNGKVRGKFSAPSGIKEKEALRIAIKLPEVQKWLGDKMIKKSIFVQGKLLNIVLP